MEITIGDPRNIMKKQLLCITPDLSQSGAPIALYGLLLIISQKEEYSINILTYGSGELLSDYAGLVVYDHIEILNGLNPTPEFRNRIQSSYDIVILNTAAVYPFAFYFQNLNIPVYWWIHEAPALIEESFPGFPNPHLLSPNFRLFASSAGASAAFNNHYAYDIHTLPVPVYKPDAIKQDLPFELPQNRIIFAIPSAYTYIKGQDILLSAIRALPDEYRQKSYFVFCGYSLEKQAEYKKNLINTAAELDNVLMLDNLPKETVYSLMSNCHCVIAPSRIDTIPLTIVEGMMFNKLTLVSSDTGISHYIKDCHNGFIFNNSEELLKRLLLIINDYNSLKLISERGADIYNKYFSPASVSSVCNDIGLL